MRRAAERCDQRGDCAGRNSAGHQGAGVIFGHEHKDECALPHDRRIPQQRHYRHKRFQCIGAAGSACARAVGQTASQQAGQRIHTRSRHQWVVAKASQRSHDSLHRARVASAHVRLFLSVDKHPDIGATRALPVRVHAVRAHKRHNASDAALVRIREMRLHRVAQLLPRAAQQDRGVASEGRVQVHGAEALGGVRARRSSREGNAARGARRRARERQAARVRAPPEGAWRSTQAQCNASAALGTVQLRARGRAPAHSASRQQPLLTTRPLAVWERGKQGGAPRPPARGRC